MLRAGPGVTIPKIECAVDTLLLLLMPLHNIIIRNVKHETDMAS
jgi:hypothetical protein